MPKTLQRYLIFLFTVISGLCYSQIFPVQGNAALIPPFSLKLSDYGSSIADRVAVNILLADPSRPELTVRMRLRIESQSLKIETKQEYIGTAITLQGGIPLRLTNIDLGEYFNSDNLNFSGISKSEFLKTGSLPEGFYQFCFEVLEYNRGVKISNTICAPAWLILNDPPLINTPRDGEKVKSLLPQNIVFQWTPRHTGSPNSAFTTEYDFQLVELWPSNRNPNDAILSQPPIYEITTSSTLLVYGPDATPLEPGRHYAFRVRARSITGADELDLFKNNGYSQVSSFIYGDACDAPQNVIADPLGPSRFAVTWQENFNHTGYSVNYRLANDANANWYTTKSLTNDLQINSLKPGTRYEYQVSASCGSYESAFSPIASVTTKSSETIAYSCGLPLAPFNLDPSQLIEILKVGDVIQAGDFEVILAKVSGSNGTFTGEGVIEVPYFNKAKVKAEFSNISVNKELRMVAGVMNITGAGVDVIPSGLMDFMDDLNETLAITDSLIADYEANLPEQFDPHSFVASQEIKVPGSIAQVYSGEGGSVVVVDSKGNKQTIPAGTTAAVTDSNGNGYLVDAKGNIHKTTASVAAVAAHREYNLGVKFANASDATFGFDEKKHDPIAGTYEKLSNDYYASWKSVETGKIDKVIAKLEGADADKSQIHFEQGGIDIGHQASGNPPMPNAKSLTIQGKADGVEEGLIALFTPADTSKKEQVLGKLNVVTYNSLQKTVVIVPVNGTTFDKFGTAAMLRDSLNRIYNQAVTSWNVEMAEGIWVAGISPFDDGGSGLLSNYTGHMKSVISTYKDSIKDNTYYLFLVSNAKDPSTLGYMPRSKESGFIFADTHGSLGAIARTMAHELGHGAFNLHHTFLEPNFTLTKGTTNNLMDYPAGPKLYKYQWDKMRYPDIVMGLFESDEEGKYQTDGHYWTVYLVSLMLGIKDDIAQELSYHTEFPDGVVLGDSYAERYTWIEKDAQQHTHVLNGKYGPDVTKETVELIRKVDRLNFEEIGRLLHRLGDSYAHRKLDGSGYLYGWQGPFPTLQHAISTWDGFKPDPGAPDMIYKRPGLYEEYVDQLANILIEKYSEAKVINKADLWKKVHELAMYATVNKVSLIGIINYEVAKYNKLKKFMVHSNYTYLSTDYEKQVENTMNYLRSKQIGFTSKTVETGTEFTLLH